MHIPILAHHMRVLAVAFASVAAIILSVAPAAPSAGVAQSIPACSGKIVSPGDDLDAVVNADPAGTATTFCIKGGTYPLSASLNVRAGDKLIGEPGTRATRGPATYPVSVPVKITNGANLSRLVTLYGSNVRLSWLDLSGAKGTYNNKTRATCSNWGDVANRCPNAGTGMAIGAGQANATTVMRHLRVHNNDALGIGSANGKILNSAFFSNSSNPDWHGFESASIKGIDEYEVAYNFVHDEQANGIWCDHGCDDSGAAMPNGFWVHHNLVVNNGRWGIRYEYSPRIADDTTQNAVTALVENNEIHGNGTDPSHSGGGASMEDAQDGTFRNNNLGPAKIAGFAYPRNENGRAIVFGWSKTRPERTDLHDGAAMGNHLDGESVSGCGMSDDDSSPGVVLVSCSNNAP